MEGSGSAIEVTAKFFPLAFLLFMTKPTIEIDRKPNTVSWGKHRFDVSPGRHTVKVSFKYLWLNEAGANSIDVEVPVGATVRVRYYMPPWMFAKGSLKVQA